MPCSVISFQHFFYLRKLRKYRFAAFGVFDIIDDSKDGFIALVALMVGVHQPELAFVVPQGFFGAVQGVADALSADTEEIRCFG